MPVPPGLWQFEQLPNAVASCVKDEVAQVVVLLWQVSHWAVVATWLSGFICAFSDR